MRARPVAFRRLRLPGTDRTVVVAYQQSDARRACGQQGIDALQPLAGVAHCFIATYLLILFMARSLLGQRAGDLGFAPALPAPAFSIALPLPLGPRRGQRSTAIAVRGAQPRLPARPDRGLQAGRILRKQAPATAPHDRGGFNVR